MRFAVMFVVLSSVACSESDLSRTDDIVVPPRDTDNTVDPGTLPIPVATAPLYAQTKDELFEVDPTNGDITSIGTFRTEDGNTIDDIVDIAIDLEGRLFGGTYDALYQVDPETAEVTYRCEWSGAPPFALAFTSDGALVAGAGEEIRFISVDDCASSTLLTSRDYETSGDLVGLPDGFLYWSVRGGRDNPDELVRVNPRNGREIAIGSIGFQGLYGMAYFDGRLYGFSDTGQMVRIEPGNASSFLLGTSNDKRWYGATTNPVKWD